MGTYRMKNALNGTCYKPPHFRYWQAANLRNDKSESVSKFHRPFGVFQVPSSHPSLVSKQKNYKGTGRAWDRCVGLVQGRVWTPAIALPVR
eukprot:2988262-Prymnesium_polylepis.1